VDRLNFKRGLAPPLKVPPIYCEIYKAIQNYRNSNLPVIPARHVRQVKHGMTEFGQPWI